MPTYTESEYPTILSTNNGSGMFGNSDGFWGIILLALLFGWGRGGYGFGGGSYGTPATQADLANGFAQNTLQRGIDDIILGQAQMQNWINQGFSGINTSLLTGFHGVDNAVCTLGYNMATGFNGISSQLASCCCDTRGAIADVKYANERQTCDLITNQNANTQRIIDYLTNEKIDGLRAENVALKGRISNDAQSAYIIDKLAPKQPIPAYPVFPSTSFAYPSGVTFGVGNNCGCASVQ